MRPRTSPSCSPRSKASTMPTQRTLPLHDRAAATRRRSRAADRRRPLARAHPRAPRGEHGFGYDPIFFDPVLGTGAAELDAAVKNRVSHRGQALAQALRAQRSRSMNAAALPLSLYVHIPWCVKKCPYCDFNSHARGSRCRSDAYIDALMRDLDRDLAARARAERRKVVFFGGGTPSLFAPDEIARILDATNARLDFATASRSRWKRIPARSSTAASRTIARRRQSHQLRRAELRRRQAARLGRIHSAAEAERAIKTAQDAGLDNINLDLMYALPEQTLEARSPTSTARSRCAAAHLALPADARTEHAVRRESAAAARRRRAWDMQEACQRGWPRPVSRNTKFRRTRATARSAGTTSTTGRSATTSASAPARTAKSRRRDGESPPLESARAAQLSRTRGTPRSVGSVDAVASEHRPSNSC